MQKTYYQLHTFMVNKGRCAKLIVHSIYQSISLSLHMVYTSLVSRSLYLNFNFLVSVTAGGPVSPRGHM